jgi:Nucleotide modification associated domain 2
VNNLYTYTIPYDDGAAPNPFHGMCTLAICKPAVRRSASVGDWVAGLSSKNSPSGDLSGCLVYAMHVDEVLTMREYDRQASRRWPHRIPNVKSFDLSDRLGDCIYDYSKDPPLQRKGVHGPNNAKTDLGGRNVLLSRDYYYFGGQVSCCSRNHRCCNPSL